METKEMLDKIDDAIEMVKIARKMLVGNDDNIIEEAKDYLEKAYRNLLSEWAMLRMEWDKEQREPS